jgi:hypothetical protein
MVGMLRSMRRGSPYRNLSTYSIGAKWAAASVLGSVCSILRSSRLDFVRRSAMMVVRRSLFFGAFAVSRLSVVGCGVSIGRKVPNRAQVGNVWEIEYAEGNPEIGEWRFG